MRYGFIAVPRKLTPWKNAGDKSFLDEAPEKD